MDALLTYLRETRTTPKAFAKMIGVDISHFDDILAGVAALDASLAQRMIDATGGALMLEDLVGETGGEIVDLRSRFVAGGADIDVESLAGILAMLLPELIGGARRSGDKRLPALAAEAAANTYAALSTVTSRSGADRLMQALRPVVSEILEEMSAPRQPRRDPEAMIRRAAEIYFQANPKTRRA
ncbi:MAG: hypothetical protein KDD85_08495 [Parvularculaceae bacterium]|nr:hypothetical protein [Parvularculaceae bacterium]